MIKNRPWQVIALIIAHTASLAYIFYRFFLTYPITAYAYPPLIFSAVLGVITLAFFFTKQKAGPVLECLYFILLAFNVHYLDLLIYMVVVAYPILCRATRRHYAYGGLTPKTESGEKPVSKKLSGIIRTIIVVLVSLTVSAVAMPVVNNLSKVFYIVHSKEDYQILSSYVEQNYPEAQVNYDDYKEYGCVYLYIRGDRGGEVEISNGVIVDRIILDELEMELEQRLEENAVTDYGYSVYLGAHSSDGRKYAQIMISDYPKSIGRFAESYLRDEQAEADGDSPPDDPAGFCEPVLYEVFCELIDSGYEVNIENSSGFSALAITYSYERGSVLLPFLNPKTDISETERYYPNCLTFTQICAEDEFYSKVGAYIEESQDGSSDYDRALQEEMDRTQAQRKMTMISLWAAIISALFISAPLYALHSIGIYTIMKKRGLKPLWLAWVPYLCEICFGIIAQDIDRKYEREKRRVRRMAILMVWLAVSFVAMNVFSMRDRLERYTTFEPTWGILAAIAIILFFVFYIMYLVAYFSALWQIFIQYSPRNVTLFKVLSFLFGQVATPIILFCIRGNVPLQDRPPSTGYGGDFPYGPYEKPITAGKQDLGGMYSNLSNRLYNAGLGAAGPDMPESDAEEIDIDGEESEE